MLATEDRLELIQACRDGERDAFRVLFDTHRDRVYSIALHYAGDSSAAMDITQDVFVKLFAAIGSFRGAAGAASFDSWLYRLTVNACMDHRRRGRRLVPLPDLPLLDRFLFRTHPAPPAELAAERAETYARIRDAVSRLPADLRIAVVLRYTEGLSYEEIAAATGAPMGTVASRLNRAHKLLARTLGDLAPPALENEQ
ncbi:MAG: sigma-70 family RNA polymerase sigma factor [Bryobacteraceae bacterium]